MNTCNLCGSFTHYKARCQHNPVQYVDMDQDYVDFHVNYIPGDGEEEGDHKSKVEDTITGAMAQLNSQSDQKSFYATLDSFVVLDVLAGRAQGAQFQARRFADFFPVQFDCGVVDPGFPEAFEPGLPGAERFDCVVEPTGVPGGRW